MPIVDLVEVRDRLGLGTAIPDETVTHLRDAVEAAILAVYPAIPSDLTAPADAKEAVLQLCKDTWLAGRHSYDTDGAFTPQITSNTLQRYGALLAAYRDVGTLAT